MTVSTVSLAMLIGVAIMLLSLVSSCVAFLVLKKRKKKLVAALKAEYGDCGSLRR